MKTWMRLTSLGLIGWLAACSSEAPSQAPTAPNRPTTPVTGSAGKSSVPASTLPVNQAGSSAPISAAAGSGGATTAKPAIVDGDCAGGGAFKKEGCACRAGETAACWTGSAADRNLGACHDGLQVCNATANGEFASWGPCMGEQHSCGTDAGVPPPPEEECGCIPGAVIQCSEDCTVGIICSLTATKTCLPDGTWSTCREELGVQLDLPGFQCRNMLHGCAGILLPGMTKPGDGEIYVGDCSKQFKCGHPPPPPPPPVVAEPPK